MLALRSRLGSEAPGARTEPMTRICVLDGFSNDLVEDPVSYADEVVMRFSPASGKFGRLLDRGGWGSRDRRDNDVHALRATPCTSRPSCCGHAPDLSKVASSGK